MTPRHAGAARACNSINPGWSEIVARGLFLLFLVVFAAA